MKPVFADSSYYVALLSERDEWHSRALETGDNLLGRVYTTEHVLVETASMLCKGQDRQAYVGLVRELQVDDSVVIIPASADLDCMSFVIMKRHRISQALTTDRHFIQAGFRALLRES